MDGILAFFQSDFGKMLIAILVGLFFGGKNPALVNWILEFLKLQKPTPQPLQAVDYDDENYKVDMQGAIKGVADLRIYFNEEHPDCIEAHNALNTVWKHIGEVHIDKSGIAS